jgi:hypothetical protein
MHNIFREIQVWKRLSDKSAVRYSCVSDLSAEKYAVQSADFFRIPIDESQIRGFEKQFVELFIEESVLDRCEWFTTLELAISAHDQEFS